MNKILCIYHANCADGFGAAWVVRKWAMENGREIEFHPGVYGEPAPNVEGKDVYVVDFSYAPEAMYLLQQQAASFNWIDHHKSAIESWQKFTDSAHGLVLYKWVDFLDMEHSGAMLTWMYFYPHDTAPRLIQHIEDRDIWKFALPATREIQAALFSYPYDFEIWDKLMNPDLIPDLIGGGVAIERKHFKDIEELLKVTTRWMQIGNQYVPTASLPYTLASDAGHQLCKQLELGELQLLCPIGISAELIGNFAATYYDTQHHRIFSLRSLPGGADVSEVAQIYGGGGHEHAAGFRVPRDHPLAKA